MKSAQIVISWHREHLSDSRAAALNPRVRGSSPWRRTRPDLVFPPFPAPACPAWYGRRLAMVWPTTLADHAWPTAT
jgi:hypothetical protein